MKRTKTNSIAALIALCLTGCATPYGGEKWYGGYSEVTLNDRLTKVNFRGNADNTAEQVRQFTLYRCAELARNAGKGHFVLYDSLNAAAQDRPSAAPRGGQLGPTRYAFALITFEDEPRKGSLETAKVLADLSATVRQSSASEKGKP